MSVYRATSASCSGITWFQGLLAELNFCQHGHTPLHADNTNAIHITEDPAFHDGLSILKLIVTIFEMLMNID